VGMFRSEPGYYSAPVFGQTIRALLRDKVPSRFDNMCSEVMKTIITVPPPHERIVSVSSCVRGHRQGDLPIVDSLVPYRRMMGGHCTSNAFRNASRRSHVASLKVSVSQESGEICNICMKFATYLLHV
jgi:hypothetical protein